MDIKELKHERELLQLEIAQFVSDKINDFFDKTAINVTDVGIEIMRIDSMGCQKKTVCTGSVVSLDLE